MKYLLYFLSLLTATAQIQVIDQGSGPGTRSDDNPYETISKINSNFNYLSSGNSSYINVTHPPYNAVGDGVTDDTAAIQAAVDAAVNKELIFPQGTYLIDSRRLILLESHSGI